MKLGLFINAQYLPGELMPRKIQESVEQVSAARRAGFDLICAGQHYLSVPYQMSATFPLLARLAAESGDMEVASTVILVPLHNPVELAESVATMDAICGGRFVFGVGLGYRDEEYPGCTPVAARSGSAAAQGTAPRPAPSPAPRPSAP